MSALRAHRENLSNLDFQFDGQVPPPSLVSPAFTPPSTPGGSSYNGSEKGQGGDHRKPHAVPVDTAKSSAPGPRLLETLPKVECQVRARIPTTTGQETFLHLYTNNADNKEHLAIVFGPHIRSRSLDRERPGETEMARMVRGAYVGRLYPGRTSSRVDERKDVPTKRPSIVSPPEVSFSASRRYETVPKEPNKAQMNGIHEEDEARTDTSSDRDSEHQSYPSWPEPAFFDSNIDPQIGDSPSFSRFNPRPRSAPLVRIHSECYTGETVWSARCDCGEQLDEAARLMSSPHSANTPNIENDPGGVIVYLRQEGRGIGLAEKLKAYNLQDLGSDTKEANIILRHPADARTYGLATSILMDLGLEGETGIRLLTNNPDKIRAVEGPNREIRVRERVSMIPLAWKTGGKAGINSVEVQSYLKAKIEQFGHMLGEP